MSCAVELLGREDAKCDEPMKSVGAADAEQPAVLEDSEEVADAAEAAEMAGDFHRNPLQADWTGWPLRGSEILSRARCWTQSCTWTRS